MRWRPRGDNFIIGDDWYNYSGDARFFVALETVKTSALFIRIQSSDKRGLFGGRDFLVRKKIECKDDDVIMVLHVLNVAEKPSVAKALSEVFSNISNAPCSSTAGRSKYNRVFTIDGVQFPAPRSSSSSSSSPPPSQYWALYNGNTKTGS